MKSYTKEEFIEYVKGLKFEELEDIGNFIKEYYEYYDEIPKENKEAKDDAWEKYAILMTMYGMTFISFALSVIGLRKVLEDEIEQEKNRSAGSLATGTD